MLDTLGKDVRYGFRTLWKKPGFSITAIVTLALGIGASTAIFSVVNGVLLRPLPYKDAGRIVTIWQNDLRRGIERQKVSPANFLDFKERNNVFEAMATMRPYGLDYTEQGEPETLQCWLVTERFFEIMGVDAMLGRTFQPNDYQPGQEKVALLSYGLWKRRFGSNPNLVGQKIALEGEPYTVVGILPAEFHFTDKRELMVPHIFSPGEKRRRGATYLYAFGRLKPGVTVEQARAEMSTIGAQIAQEQPETNREVGVTIVPLSDELLGEVRPALRALLGAVGLLLLIACTNVANLLLVRGVHRRREFAMRAALGATRKRLVYQLLTENFILAFLGGVLGLLLGWGAHRFLSLSPANLPRVEEIRLDGTVLAFALGISLLTALIFGLMPLIHSSKPDLQSTLREGGLSATPGFIQHRLRNLLVASQIALALVLLIGAGLLGRSFMRLLQINPGFTAENVLTLQVHVYNLYPSPEQQIAYFEQVLERLTTLPDVKAVGAVSAPPFVGEGSIEINNAIAIEGRPEPLPGQEPTAYQTVVTTDYFRTLHIPLLRGRTFTSSDRQQAPPVALVNETMSHRYWQNDEPLGKRITIDWSDKPMTVEIIGVVGDVRHTGLDSDPRAEMFLHLPQAPIGSMTFVVRTGGDPLLLLSSIKNEVWQVNKNQPIYSIRTEEQLISDSLRERRFSLSLFGIFAFISLVLAGVGLYGLISFSTSQRTHEMAVRIALGAQSRTIMKLIIGQGLLLALSGIVVGLAGAFLLTRFLRTMLFGITPTDLFTFASISVLLVLVALLASYIPARRATKVDPMMVLRQE